MWEKTFPFGGIIFFEGKLSKALSKAGSFLTSSFALVAAANKSDIEVRCALLAISTFPVLVLLACSTLVVSNEPYDCGNWVYTVRDSRIGSIKIWLDMQNIEHDFLKRC